MKLKNKTAIITGAGSGIGRGTALAMRKQGADIAICDIDVKGLGETEIIGRKMGNIGAEILTYRLDVRNCSEIQLFVKTAFNHFGRIDILANIAGIMPVELNEEIGESTVDDILDVNLKAPIMFTKYVIPHMRAGGGGSIIHMASVTGHNGHPGVVVYGATKGGLMALARGQAMELAKDNIRVNTVSPGTVDSPMLQRFLQDEAEDMEKARAGFDSVHPRGRIASVQEVASVLVFLAGDDSANITGEDIRCDGGYCVQGFQPKE